MKKTPVDWTVMDYSTQEAKCLRCGDVKKLRLPISLTALRVWGEYFIEKHRGCREEITGENGAE